MATAVQSQQDRSDRQHGTVRLTAAQALVRYLQSQFSERDGIRRRVIPAAFGIFGHGNVAGVGQALQEFGENLTYYQPKNEQAMVHAAIGFAKANDRMSTLACTASIGPGSTNMITGAATATVNRVPVLLLPSDTFANRRQGPVLQQLEHPAEADLSVSDCFRPVSRFFDRITRPEQLLASLPQAMRILLDQAETGAVTLSLHQDVQGEAYDYPEEFFEERTWQVARRPPAAEELDAALTQILAAERPVIIAGGGVRYSNAGHVLGEFSREFGIPVAETFAGKTTPGPQTISLGGLGVTGTQAAFEAVSRADVVLAVGTRLADFATGSHSIFGHPEVSFVGVNVCAADAYKLGATPVVADARSALEALGDGLRQRDFSMSDAYRFEVEGYRAGWHQRMADDLDHDGHMSQGQVLNALNEQAQEGDALVAAAGSPPGDLLRLWEGRGESTCYLEFGYSCMAHEIPAALGVRLARGEARGGEVFAVIGDGTYLMGNTELVTAVQEQLKVIVLVIDNHGYQCIRALQLESTGGEFGNEFRNRVRAGGSALTGDWVPVDHAASARAYGCTTFQADDLESLRQALREARSASGPVVIVARVDPYRGLVGSDTWWDVGVAEVSQREEARQARAEHERGAERQRFYG